jgi:Protein of unknown function (DUF4230)
VIRYAGGMTGKRLLYALAAILLALIAIIWIINRAAGPDTESVASAALKGIREQNRLTAFAANYSAVVTSEQRRFGLSARKTLIMQGLVRYEVDLAKLASNDVRWDSGANTLRVRISDIEVSRPQIDLGSIQEYGDGGILIALTDADRSLDTANRAKGERELIEQARGPVPMRLARDATRRAIAQNFAVPLKAAGIEARVEAKFGDEMVGKVDTRWDLSTPLEEIVRK